MGRKKRTFEQRVVEVKAFMRKMAHKLSTTSAMEYDDAHQEMLISVWNSYRCYDERIKKTAFSTYAITRMINRSKTLLHRYNSKADKVPVLMDSYQLDQMIDERRDETLVIITDSLLTTIEKILYERRNDSLSDKRVYVMFCLMRKGMTMQFCARRMNVSLTWLSRLFSEKVRPLKDLIRG